MALNNAVIHQIYSYIPDTTKTLSAPVIVAGDLSGVSYTDSSHELLGEQWGAVTPEAKFAWYGLDAKGGIKCSAFTAKITMSAALTAGQAVKLIIDSATAGLDDKPLGIVAAFNNGSGDLRIVSQKIIPAVYTRQNAAASADVEFLFPRKPLPKVHPTTAAIEAALAGDTATVYGVTPILLAAQLGQGGVDYNHSTTSYDSIANDIKVSFASAKSGELVLNINAMNADTYAFLLKLIGYKPMGDGSYAYGNSEPLKTFVLDLDEDPRHDTGSNFERRVLLSVGTETLAAANINKAYNAKEQLAITLPIYSSTYAPLGGEIVQKELAE